MATTIVTITDPEALPASGIKAVEEETGTLNGIDWTGEVRVIYLCVRKWPISSDTDAEIAKTFTDSHLLF